MTAATLESAPRNQPVPLLIPIGDSANAHHGVMATWGPPTLPNGVIRRYRLQRRAIKRVTLETVTEGATVLVYEGTLREFFDNSSALLPYSEYQYRVTAFNNQTEGAISPWASIRTKEAAPVGVFGVRVEEAFPRSLRVQIPPPGAKDVNGYVLSYNIIVNASRRSSSRLLTHHIQGLVPFTVYSLRAQLCTAVGCTEGPVTTARTLPTSPGPVPRPRLTSVTNDSAEVSWSAPSKPNGILSRYVISFR